MNDATRIPATVCVCGQEHSAASHDAFNHQPPRAGDLTLCIRCGRLYQFGEGLTVQLLDDKAYRALPADVRTRIDRVRLGIRQLRAQS